MTLQFYNRKGEVVSPEQWFTEMSSTRFRIGLDKIPGGHVSTVLLIGATQRFGEGSPLLFESMIFMRDVSSPLHQWADKYSTEREAKAGHAVIRKVARRFAQLRNGPAPLKVKMRR